VTLQVSAVCIWRLLLAALLAPGGTAPGVVGLIGGFGLVAAGMVLLVLVMRSLLTQATQLRSELDEVAAVSGQNDRSATSPQ